MNNQFPKIADVPATDTKFIDYVPQLEKEKFKRAVIQFFKFYASQYQIKNHIIGVNFGRWKNRIMEGKQTNHTPEEEKCVMLYYYIQSYVVHLTNANTNFLLD